MVSEWTLIPIWEFDGTAVRTVLCGLSFSFAAIDRAAKWAVYSA